MRISTEKVFKPNTHRSGRSDDSFYRVHTKLTCSLRFTICSGVMQQTAITSCNAAHTASITDKSTGVHGGKGSIWTTTVDITAIALIVPACAVVYCVLWIAEFKNQA